MFNVSRVSVLSGIGRVLMCSSIALAVATDVDFSGVRLALANCFQVECDEEEGAHLWDGSSILTECIKAIPASCFDGIYSYGGMDGLCEPHNNVRTVMAFCGASSWECTDNSASGLYACSPNANCVNESNPLRMFCADGGIGVDESWNEGEDADH